MFTTSKDQRQFDSWSKEDIYEAYLAEHVVRLRTEEEVKKLNRKLAEIRFMVSSKAMDRAE